ncbi:hypothetical protein [Paenibacillus apiarius]|uniref:hypothetical protein n=1 Tax=Paenibacillus apiarius TaxID=46240 RepID=UPI003B3ADCC8
MQGWIKLHRKILKSPLFKQLNSKQRDVMMTVLLLANHDSNTWEFKGQIYEVQPGQFITSLDSLQENCASDVSIQNIRTALLKLEKHGFLTNESTKKNRLITVVNWGFYQGCDVDANKDINSQPTNNQQTANKQLTTNKNVKNKENEKNDEKDSCCSDDIESILGLNEKQDTVPESSETGTDSGRKISVQEYRGKVTTKYLQRRGKGWSLSNKDETEIDKYISARIPLSLVLRGIDQSFDNFKPEHARDEIKSLKYCSPVVFSLYAQQGTVPAAEASGTVPEVDAVPPGEECKENVNELLEQLKQMRGDTG